MGLAERLIRWQRQAGRHDLPWQGSRDPYRIWVSEIMLQQTQVATVAPYYRRFTARFPDLAALAAAPLEHVLACWSGLGYYARARNLHACARVLVERHGGCWPGSAAQLAQLPGVGRSTAAAIAAFAYGERAAILDGNVRRVLCRHFGVEGVAGSAALERALWRLAERELPERDVDVYTQALMDLGATVCLRAAPRCDVCPVAADCVAHREQRTAELPVPRRRAPARHRQLGRALL
ncbi:MAG TPA: A/G-specific adenine glycosylase, partial [Burkholderiaceae bacterium]|nr:A/G-specific adenine glycosylase [Burkholderiaceae bacterium]